MKTMSPLYNDPKYISFALAILEGRGGKAAYDEETPQQDLGPALVCADWLEETRSKDPVSLSLASHLRRGLPVPDDFSWEKGSGVHSKVTLKDYNWEQAFGYAGQPNTYGCSEKGGAQNTMAPPHAQISTHPFAMWDVKEVVAAVEGEHDGPNWVIVGHLYDGRWFTLRAGCDYTGWD